MPISHSERIQTLTSISIGTQSHPNAEEYTLPQAPDGNQKTHQGMESLCYTTLMVTLYDYTQIYN